MRICACIGILFLVCGVLTLQASAQNRGKSVATDVPSSLPGGIAHFGGGAGGGDDDQNFDLGWIDKYSAPSYVPAGATCPPRCPDDLLPYLPATPVPVFNFNDREKEIEKLIDDLKIQLDIDNTLRQAFEILTSAWMLEYGAGDIYNRASRDAFQAAMKRLVQGEIQAMATEAVNARLKSIYKTEPFFWDIRPNSRLKRQIIEEAASELQADADQTENEIRTSSVVQSSQLDSSGHILYRPGNAIRQAGKINRDKRWQNQ